MPFSDQNFIWNTGQVYFLGKYWWGSWFFWRRCVQGEQIFQQEFCFCTAHVVKWILDHPSAKQFSATKTVHNVKAYRSIMIDVVDNGTRISTKYPVSYFGYSVLSFIIALSKWHQTQSTINTFFFLKVNHCSRSIFI